MTLISTKTGTVKFPAGKTFTNKFNPEQLQQSLLLSMADETEERIYFDAGRLPHSSLVKGQSVQVNFEQNEEGKTFRKLIVSDSSTNNNSNTELSDKRKKDIANFINSQADILGFCLDTANQKFSSKVQSEESIRTLATTLYIATQKQYF